MRQRIDDRAKKLTPASLEKLFKEIVVGTGRAQEPYIIAFHYASDNVAGKDLGTLFGFFEVEIHDQDAAYIVNFLASVAKKEYFANPRRSPTDSFDAALHKINVALAEIVKHGNVSWLGHLHGALGAVSHNTIHFSVTGEGELYLARQENFHSISTGLADTGSEPHPLKTFTEVSSGELFDGDLVIALSPSVWSLFSPEELARSLNRLGPAGFEQFLRTALINELPVAAAAILLCSAPVEVVKPLPVKKEPKKAPANLENVWSGKTFSDALKATTRTDERDLKSTSENAREEYTDSKTGHIYVQASNENQFDVPESRWKESFDVFLHHAGLQTRSLHIAFKKTFRRIGKESGFLVTAASSELSAWKRASDRRARLLRRSLEERFQRFQEARRVKKEIGIQRAESIIEKQVAPAASVSASPIQFRNEARETAPTRTDRVAAFARKTKEVRLLVRSVSDTSWEHFKGWFSALSATWATRLRPLASRVITAFLLLPKKMKWLIGGGMTLIVLGSLFFTLQTTEQEVVAPEAPETAITPIETAPAFPPADEPLSIRLSGERVLAPISDSPTLALTNINDIPFLITEKRITNLKTQESTNAPETLRLAAGMDDLDAIFVLSESGTLYLYSITTKKFEANTLPLATGTNIDALGSYLTYLYVLDRSAGIIYRLPRAEGGFGAPTAWSKESLSLKEKSAMSVYENIALAGSDGRPLVFTRGKNTGVTFSGSIAPIMTDALSFNPKNGDVFALDRKNKRIVRWSLTGTLINQYFHESFDGIEAILVSSDGTELLTSRNGATNTWRIQ